MNNLVCSKKCSKCLCNEEGYCVCFSAVIDNSLEEICKSYEEYNTSLKVKENKEDTENVSL